MATIVAVNPRMWERFKIEHILTESIRVQLRDVHMEGQPK